MPSRPKPGSVESLIDDLINVREPGDSDERYARVLDLGFEAVPALLDHLGDDRLTRYRYHSDFISGTGRVQSDYHYRVSDVAGDLLMALAGRSAAAGWPGDHKDRGAIKRAAAEWWDKARRQGEEAYLLAHVLPAPRKDEPGEDEWPESAHVRLLGKKYPRRLGPLYKDVLENRPRVQTWRLAEAIGASSLPREERVELLTLGVTNKNMEHRYAAFFPLKDLDAERFVTLLVAALDDLPQTPAAPYANCREAWFALLVCKTDDPRAWRALERAARRADAGLRMEMLNHTDYPEPTATQRRRRLAFLAAFLDDHTVRDVDTNKKMFESIYAGFSFPRLEVRNFAALRISKIIRAADDPTPDWTAEEWERLRHRMRAAVKRELAEAAKE